MTGEPDTLDCDHCGGIAIRSDDGLWTDSSGTKCDECGMPGHVVVDDQRDGSLVDVRWSDVQEAGVFCARPDCEECNEWRAEADRLVAGVRVQRNADEKGTDR